MNNKLMIYFGLVMLIIGIMLGYALAIATVKVNKLPNNDIALTWLEQDFIHQVK